MPMKKKPTTDAAAGGNTSSDADASLSSELDQLSGDALKHAAAFSSDGSSLEDMPAWARESERPRVI